MGAGMGLYVPEAAAAEATRVGRELGFQLEQVGRVARGARAVDIAPLGIRFEGSSLRLRMEGPPPRT
jgi:hypothetical protein